MTKIESAFTAKMELKPGKDAPLYPEGTEELDMVKIVITEQATENGLPIVDFVMKGQHGEQYLIVLSGRIVLSLAALLRGVNARNHGTPEP